MDGYDQVPNVIGNPMLED